MTNLKNEKNQKKGDLKDYNDRLEELQEIKKFYSINYSLSIEGTNKIIDFVVTGLTNSIINNSKAESNASEIEDEKEKGEESDSIILAYENIKDEIKAVKNKIIELNSDIEDLNTKINTERKEEIKRLAGDIKDGLGF
jgi:tRNA-binding EMAP/Myf-like protein